MKKRKSLAPTVVRIPDRSTLSESLYRPHPWLLPGTKGGCRLNLVSSSQCMLQVTGTAICGIHICWSPAYPQGMLETKTEWLSCHAALNGWLVYRKAPRQLSEKRSCPSSVSRRNTTESSAAKWVSHCSEGYVLCANNYSYLQAHKITSLT